MTIDILICTIDEGVGSVSQVLMQPTSGVHYVVSVQYTKGGLPEIPAALAERADVTVTVLEGRGLSRNRNNALAHATGDVVVIADDDCRYTPQQIERVRRVYAERPQAGAICFEAESYDGRPLKAYPSTALPYIEAQRRGYYPTSMELTFRRPVFADTNVCFDERFGLGASLPAGEEEVLLADLQRAGVSVWFVPEVITSTDPVTTGDRFLADARLQMTKGAVFRHCYGVPSALWRTLKEGAHHFVHHHANPLSIWLNMLRGIWR